MAVPLSISADFDDQRTSISFPIDAIGPTAIRVGQLICRAVFSGGLGHRPSAWDKNRILV